MIVVCLILLLISPISFSPSITLMALNSMKICYFLMVSILLFYSHFESFSYVQLRYINYIYLSVNLVVTLACNSFYFSSLISKILSTIFTFFFEEVKSVFYGFCSFNFTVFRQLIDYWFRNFSFLIIWLTLLIFYMPRQLTNIF